MPVLYPKPPRSAFHSGNAILEDCEDIKRQLCRLAAVKWGCAPEDVTYTAEGMTQSKKGPGLTIPIDEVGKSGIMHE